MREITLYLKPEHDPEEVAELVEAYLADAGYKVKAIIGEDDGTLGMTPELKRGVARRLADTLD